MGNIVSEDMVVANTEIEDELLKLDSQLASQGVKDGALFALKDVMHDQMEVANMIRGGEPDGDKPPKKGLQPILQAAESFLPAKSDSPIPRFSVVGGIPEPDDVDALKAQIALLQIQLEHEKVKNKELAA